MRPATTTRRPDLVQRFSGKITGVVAFAEHER